jgi:hypothetical protein
MGGSIEPYGAIALINSQGVGIAYPFCKDRDKSIWNSVLGNGISEWISKNYYFRVQNLNRRN